MGQEAKGAGDNMDEVLYCGFHEKEQGRQGEQARVGSFPGLGCRAVPSCLIAAPGVSGQESSGPEYKSPTKEWLGLWGLDWLVCTGKVLLQGSHFLLLGTGKACRVSKAPRCENTPK